MVRTFLGLLLAAPAVVAGFGYLGSAGLTKDIYQPREIWTFSGSVFITVLVIEMVFVMPLALTKVSPAVAEEREKDTLSHLLLTSLTPVEIIVTKLIGRLIPSLSLVLTGLPLAVLCAWCAGIPGLLLVEAVAVLTSTVIVVGAFSILASARRDSVGTAFTQAMAWAFLWFLIIPTCSILPVRSGTLWGQLAMELRRLCGWIAVSSPVSLATQNAWFSSASAGKLSRQLVIMLIFQAVLIVFSVIGAVSGLRLRERHVFSWDAYRGFRPPVGDDPVFWREYTLPRRGATRPLVYYQARHIVILFRLLVTTVLQLIAMAIAVGIPVGMAIATARYGYFAFLELAKDGYFPPGPTLARDHFNYLIRGITVILAVMPLAGLPAMITGRITIERDKKTWEGLLMTPLTGAEILSSKMRISTRGLWTASRWLIPLWALGILAGSLHPLTALLAAIELRLAAWLGQGLGAWIGIRPRSASTAKAHSDASLMSLGLGVLVGLTVMMLLCSHHEFAFFNTWDIRDRIIVVAILVALPPMMGLCGWVLTRRTIRRFDEWVGRPHRQPHAESSLTSTAARSAPIEPSLESFLERTT
jgi:hypothetical protein